MLSWDAFAWHQGRWDRDKKLLGKSDGVRQSGAYHRSRYYPWYPARLHLYGASIVVTVDAGCVSAGGIIAIVANILADRIEARRLARIREAFGMAPRVRIAPLCSALDEFPAAPFHITLSTSVVFTKDFLSRLRTKLGNAVIAISVPPMGTGCRSHGCGVTSGKTCRRMPHRLRRGRMLFTAVLKLKAGAPQGAVEPQLVRYPGGSASATECKMCKDPAKHRPF